MVRVRVMNQSSKGACTEPGGGCMVLSGRCAPFAVVVECEREITRNCNEFECRLPKYCLVKQRNTYSFRVRVEILETLSCNVEIVLRLA